MKGLGGADAAGARSVWPTHPSAAMPHTRFPGCQAVRQVLCREENCRRACVCAVQKCRCPTPKKNKKPRRVGTEDTQDRRSIERGPVFAFSTPTTNPTHMF